MDDYRTFKPRAVAVAELLFRLRGRIAYDVAQHRRLAAIANGSIARADFYLAVTAILGDRDFVFSRLRLAEG